VLEQVKYRHDGTVSLRTDIVVESIANYIRAGQANPGLDVRFRFFTNARPAKEQRAQFPGGSGGIEVWNALREGALRGDEANAALAQIRNLLSEPGSASASLQDQANHRIIADFLSSVNDAQLVPCLIERFEFSMGNQAASDLRPAVERRLLELGCARSDGEANQLY